MVDGVVQEVCNRNISGHSREIRLITLRKKELQSYQTVLQTGYQMADNEQNVKRTPMFHLFGRVIQLPDHER
jgi:hypothetical protein